jgi:stage V sporulation protein AD
MKAGVERLDRGVYSVSGVHVLEAAAVGGAMEGAGPLGHVFDHLVPDDLDGTGSFEAAEASLAFTAVRRTLDKARLDASDVDVVLGGDLLNQLYSTNFAARQHQIPLYGLFSACATFTEAVGIGALLLASGGPARVVAAAASHHMAAERQFRYPIELGYQRTMTASWTATASGALLLAGSEGGGAGDGVEVTAVTAGRVIDFGSRDPMDMGTAMAPAAADTLGRHQKATGRRWSDYDQILTGDLGVVGSRILADLVPDATEFRNRHEDCGRALYGSDQDVHNGGSGAGCAAAVFAGWAYPRLFRGEMTRVLMVATGALFSPTSYQQGESIPAIAHAVEFSWRTEAS